MKRSAGRGVPQGAVARRLSYGVRVHWMDGPVVAGVLLLALLLVHNAYQPVFSAFQLQVIVNNSTALALAAVGETLIIITGGFDLSPGAVLAFVNVFLATQLNGEPGHDTAIVLAALGIGLGAGLFNGFFVAFLRVQSIIVTVATLFIFGGLALLVLREPGGSVPYGFADLLTGTLGGSFPRALILVAAAVLAWLMLRRTSFGKAVYAVGSDPAAAYMSGLPVRSVLLATYALAGLFYAVAGIFLTAQTVSGDPRIGAAFLLATFITVVIGGTRLGGGSGSAVGSIIGAFIVTMIVSVLFDVGVDSFYTGLVEGLVLIGAVLLGALAQRLRPRRLSAASTGRGGS